MKWAATLISISGYCWYLVFVHLTHGTHPGPWTGLAGLFLLALLPTWLSLAINRSLPVSSPTVLQAALVNLFLWPLLAALTVLGSIKITDYLFWNPPDPLRWTAYIFPCCWQLLSWSYGTYFVFKTAAYSAIDRPVNIATVEISLVIMIPAVFVLTMAGFPGTLLLILIAGWFLPLTLTLAVEGTGFTKTSAVRYDLVFVHAIVPPLAAAFLFIVAFFGEIRSLMRATREALAALLNYLLDLLARLFPPDAGPYEMPPGMAPISMPAGEPEKVLEPGPWFSAGVTILLLLLSIPALLGLLKLLKSRLGPVPRLPQSHYSPFKALLQALRELVMLLRALLKNVFKLATPVQMLAGKLRQKIQTLMLRWLPAKTPEQKIFRSYEAFLRLGRRLGCPIKAYETPLEYARRLHQFTGGKQPFPTVEIDRLTGLLLEAGYSNKSMSRQQAAESEMLAKRIKTLMKK